MQDVGLPVLLLHAELPDCLATFPQLHTFTQVYTCIYIYIYICIYIYMYMYIHSTYRCMCMQTHYVPRSYDMLLNMNR